MSEGILLAKVARGTLLAEEERLARLREALPQIEAVLEGEEDAVAVQATLACLLWEALPQANWCGFYRRVADQLLAVGPYQGGMGCLRIPFDKGVCGACARTGLTQRVPDVHAFPGHIACDGATRSELVIPVRVGGCWWRYWTWIAPTWMGSRPPRPGSWRVSWPAASPLGR